jgi:hypothetical protein
VSWLTLNLARLECNLHLYDYDLIDEVKSGGGGAKNLGQTNSQGP